MRHALMLAALIGCSGAELAVATSDAGVDAAVVVEAKDASAAPDARPEVKDASVVDAQVEDAGPRVCTNDLSGVGTGDFELSLTLTTTQFGTVAVANQRPVCGHGKMWDLHLVGGKLVIETDDSANYAILTSTATVNDGTAHQVVITRVKAKLTIFVDGADTGSTNSVSSFPDSMSGLKIGNGPCDGIGATVSFSGITGTIADVCIAIP